MSHFGFLAQVAALCLWCSGCTMPWTGMWTMKPQVPTAFGLNNIASALSPPAAAGH